MAKKDKDSGNHAPDTSVKIPVIWRNINDMMLYPNNPRTISKSDFERLEQSFIDNPDMINGKPLLLSNRTGVLQIIGGNSRYRVATKLGYKELPTVLFENLTEEREREILVRDNVNNGSWDMEELANSWNEDKLKMWGVKINEKVDTEREVMKKLTLKFTAEEHNTVTTCLQFLNDQLGTGNEETIIKILTDLCKPTQS